MVVVNKVMEVEVMDTVMVAEVMAVVEKVMAVEEKVVAEVMEKVVAVMAEAMAVVAAEVVAEVMMLMYKTSMMLMYILPPSILCNNLVGSYNGRNKRHMPAAHRHMKMIDK